MAGAKVANRSSMVRRFELELGRAARIGLAQEARIF